MKFGTGSNAKRTQKYGGSKYKMTYVRPNIYINKQTSPIFNCVTPVSVSLARQLNTVIVLSFCQISKLRNICITSSAPLKEKSFLTFSANMEISNT